MGQHRRGTRRRRWPLVALVALLVVAGGVVAGVQFLNRCRPVDVLVAADPAIVAPIQQALRADQERTTECARYQVVEASPTLAGDIRDGAPGLPAVWIPNSSLALDSLDTASTSAVAPGASVASSPVVLALPEADAGRYGDPAQPVGWNTLLTHPQPPALPDPAADRAGLAALTGLHTAIGDEAGRPRPAFVAAVLALAKDALPSAGAGFETVARDGRSARAFLTSEQSIVRYNEDADEPVDAVALADGPTTLDFPFVRVRIGQSAAVDEAINSLETQLRGSVAQQALGAAGLRGPDGSRLPGPGTTTETFENGGWLGAQTAAGVPPARTEAASTLRLWSALTLESRMLAVIDTSGSMAAKAGPIDRISLAVGAAQGGLALFSDTSSVGLWAFSARPAPETAWQELVPLGVLTDEVSGAPSRRAALAAAAATLPDRLGGETALYDTAVAATRAVRASYQAGASNIVVLFTDGRNEVETGIDLPTVLQTLRAEADPTRPVPLITIALGPDADVDALTQMSQATGGRSYNANTPEDIRAVFLDALSLRVCRPNC